MSFLDQIRESKKEIKRLKKVVPHIFVEYQSMLHAKDDLEDAKERYREAKQRWEQVGN